MCLAEQVVAHTRHGYFLMPGRVELQLGVTTALTGERRIGRDGEDGCGGFHVWDTAEAALAAAVTAHVSTPRALLRVFVGGAQLPATHISLAEATQEGCKRCFPMITPVSVVARGRAFNRLLPVQ